MSSALLPSLRMERRWFAGHRLVYSISFIGETSQTAVIVCQVQTMFPESVGVHECIEIHSRFHLTLPSERAQLLLSVRAN